MFNMLITCYLFLGGAGAGALTVMGALECVNAQQRFGDRPAETSTVSRRRRIRQAFTLPDEFFSRGWSFCFVALATGMLCLFADLGRPDRIINLLLSPELSAIAVGSYALVLSLACSGAFALASLLETPRISPRVIRVLAALSIAFGIATMAYTGVLLQSMASILFWQTPLLPIIFVLSSFSCGIALLLFSTSFVEARYSFVRPIVWLCRADSIAIVLEAAFLAAYLAWGFNAEGTRLAVEALVAGDLRWLFWAGLVVCGLAVPFALERFVTHGNYRTQLLWIGTFLLAGGFVLRYCIVGTADYDVTQMPDLLYGLAF
ncbi:NrfD/PsrC family molybdoenzyme membrane anchor subunit [Raoultibacter timonensis]|uniref:NrfD/PsrC family molybdoenzyme membrane anchor subunit n=1 Tax=Raoultibacter timonensis TaxID=1907662 RepID=UPI0026DB4D59|nr:NrfD/PsrC family molybdoenzyme membrane anchor subunit [Raoultibacter timonensis]